MAAVLLTPEAAKQLDELREPIRRRVVGLLERLTDWPNVSGAKPLSGDLAGHWRMRTGDYRLQFHVSGESVVVEKIGNRDRFYGD
jgi:mRNA-degrading endonuclease RelE of RelBE toxin-antitoxin system